MTRFVERKLGKVTGHYAQRQPGIAEEELADNHPDIVAYENPPPTPEQIRATTFEALPERVDMVTRLKTATPAQIDSWLAANVTNLAQARTVLGQLMKLWATRL